MPLLPRKPRLRSADILLWLYRHRPDQFTIRDIMQQYEIQRGDAQRRVNYMRFVWNAVKLSGDLRAHRRGRREKTYALTAWGKRYAKQALRRGSGRAAANEGERE